MGSHWLEEVVKWLQTDTLCVKESLYISGACFYWQRVLLCFCPRIDRRRRKTI
jgi:hypothetical protein